MKSLHFLAMALFIFSTGVAPVWAQEAEETNLIDLNPRLNAMVGMSEIGVEGRRASGGIAGGATIELGTDWHTLETGALILRTGDGREGSFGLPMYAKFRVIELQSQSWFLKAGGVPVFQSAGFDVLVGGGAGGRVKMGENMDLVLDATFNHGVIDASSSMKGTNQVEGFLILTGLSFRI